MLAPDISSSGGTRHDHLDISLANRRLQELSCEIRAGVVISQLLEDLHALAKPVHGCAAGLVVAGLDIEEMDYDGGEEHGDACCGEVLFEGVLVDVLRDLCDFTGGFADLFAGEVLEFSARVGLGAAGSSAGEDLWAMEGREGGVVDHVEEGALHEYCVACLAWGDFFGVSTCWGEISDPFLEFFVAAGDFICLVEFLGEEHDGRAGAAFLTLHPLVAD